MLKRTFFGSTCLAAALFHAPALAQTSNPSSVIIQTGGGGYYYGNSAGSANAQAITVTSGGTFALTTNNSILATAAASNSGPATLNVGGTGAIAVNVNTPTGLASLVGGEIVAGVPYTYVYNGTVWVLMNPSVMRAPVFTSLPAITPANALGVTSGGQVGTYTTVNGVTGTGPINASQSGSTVTVSSPYVTGFLINNRAPTTSDNTAAGYATGALWSQSGGQIYSKTGEASGVASWSQVQPVSAYPCDGVGLTAYNCYGTVLMAQAYTGNAFTVYNGTTTQAIGFVNGIADWASADKFCAGVTCSISRINNQALTGSTHDCVFASSSYYLPYPTAPRFGIRPFLFDTAYRLSPNTANEPVCDDPNFSQTSSGGFGIFAVGIPEGTFRAGVLAQPDNTTSAGWFSIYESTLGINTSINSATIGNLSSDPQLLFWSVNGSNVTAYNDDTSYAIGGSFGSVTLTGMTWGGYSSGAVGAASFAGSLWGFGAFSGGAPTAAQVALFKEASFARFPIYPQQRIGFAEVGDSLTYGEGGQQNRSYGSWLSEDLNKPLRYINMGSPGQTCAQIDAAAYVSTYTRAYAQLAPATSSYAPNVWIVNCGTNDIFIGNASAATTYSNLQALIASQRAIDPYDPIMIGTMLPRGITGSSYTCGTYAVCEATRQTYNSLILAGIATANGGTGTSTTLGSGPIYVCNIGADPLIGAAGASFNASYYNPDDVHLVQLGYWVEAQDFTGCLRNFGLLK